MADFRKSLLLAAMALAVGVGTASAQSPTCTSAPAAVPTLRAEGQAELTGSIILQCSNLATGQSVNLDVLLNGGTIPITSRENPSEATLTTTVGATTTTYPATFVATIPGQPVNDVRFLGVAINNATEQITISGIRANVNNVQTPGSPFGSVSAFISTSNGVLPIPENTSGIFVGLVLPGLGPITTPAASFAVSSCSGGSPIGNDSNFVLSIPELFPTAFKPQGPIANTDSETGLAFGAIQANSGTQFAVTFNNIPAGIAFYIPETIHSPVGGTAELVGAEGSTLGLVSTSYIAGTTVPLSLPATDPNSTLTFLPVTSGTTVFYNVDASNASAIDIFALPTYLTGGVTAPATTQPTVTIVLAPRAVVPPPPATGGVQSISIPRFTSFPSPAAASALPGFSVTGCQTTLLFPYMTNQAGFDSGFSIAATSTDPFGTLAQGGTCTLNMYGSAAPTTAPVLTIPQGGEGHNTVSAVAPGFQGYVIAVCNFEYAHGYAFLSNGFSGIGAGGLSEGYVALEVGNTRGGTPSTTANGVSGGESLGH